MHRWIEQINASGAAFCCVQQRGVDAATSTGTLIGPFLVPSPSSGTTSGVNGSDGIKRAKVRGAYSSRRAPIYPVVIKKMRDSSAGPSAIAASLGTSGASVYRMMR